MDEPTKPLVQYATADLRVYRSRSPLSSHAPDGAMAGGLLLVYLLMIVGGYLQLRQPDVMMGGQELSSDRALFLSINAATLTGFQQAVGIDEFNPDSVRGPATILVLTLGGVLFSTIVGGLAVVRILKLPYSIRQVATAAFVSLLLAILLGTLGLMWRERSLLNVVSQSAAAFGNSGFGTGKISGALDSRAHLLLVLATAGGLGLPVLMELYDLLLGRRPRLSGHAWTVSIFTATAYLGGFLVLMLVQFPGSRAPWPVWQQALASSSIESLNTRTAGMHFEMVSALPLTAQWVLMLLMIIGASPGGTAGGLKGTTVIQLFRGARDALRGRPVPRAFGIAVTWLAAYAGIVILGVILINSVERELPGDRLLFIVISAASNVGLSHDAISIVGPSLCLLAGVMLVGRLAPLAILWWMASTTHDAELAIG